MPGALKVKVGSEYVVVGGAGSPGPTGPTGPTGPAGSGGGAASLATVPGAELTLTANEGAASATNRWIPFNSQVRTDTGLTTATGASAGVTVTDAGWYEITARAYMQQNNNATESRIEVQNTANAAVLLSSDVEGQAGVTSFRAYSVTGAVYLAAGTKVGVWLNTGSGAASLIVGGGADNRTFLRVVKLVGAAGPTGPTGPSGGPTGPTGPQGVSSGFVAPAISQLWSPLWAYGTITTATMTAGLVYVTRYQPVQETDQVWVEVTTSLASGTARVGMWADTPSGPGALLAQSADIDCSANGVKTVALTVPVGAPVWLGLQDTSAGNIGVRIVYGVNPAMTGLSTPAATTVLYGAWSRNNAGTTLPDPFGTPTSRQAQTPLMFLRAK